MDKRKCVARFTFSAIILYHKQIRTILLLKSANVQAVSIAKRLTYDLRKLEKIKKTLKNLVVDGKTLANCPKVKFCQLFQETA